MKKKSSSREENQIKDDYAEFTNTGDIYYSNKKEKRKSTVIIITAIITAIILGLIAVLTFLNIEEKDVFKKSVGKVIDKVNAVLPEEKAASIVQTNGMGKETNIMPFENAVNSKYAVADSEVIVARSNFIARYDYKGKELWSTATSVSEPLLDTNKNYTVIAEQNGTGICLYHNTKLVFSVKAENPIMTVDVSSAGDVVVTTDKEFSKGGVEVFNKEGRQIFSWIAGNEYVTGAAISNEKRRVAVSLLNTESRANTTIAFFDITDKEPYHKALLEKSVVANTEFIGSVLDVTGDNCVAGLKMNGESKWYVQYEERILSKFALDKSGNKILTLEKDAIPFIHVYDKNGKQTHELELQAAPDYIDISEKKIIYNNSRNVFFGKPEDTKKYVASMDIKNLKILNSSSFLIVYNNSLEFVY